MSGVDVEESDEVKLLGLSFSKTYTVTRNVTAKASTAAKLVNMLTRCSPFFSEQARRHIYVALIRPLLEYGSTIFCNTPARILNVFDQVQKRARRLFPTFVIDGLQHLRGVAGLCQSYNIVPDREPQLLLQHLKPQVHRPSRNT